MSAAPDATPAEGRLEAELSALGRSVGEALTRFESQLDALAGDQAERMDELETRVVGHVAALDRTEVASALTVFRELSRELGEAVSRLGAAPDPESQPANALIGDLGERLDALARTHSDKLDALELRLATQGASFDRTAVATALGALRAMGQTMQATTERFEAAVAAVEAHASAPLASPDLGTLAGEIAEIGGRLDAFASVQAEEVRRIVAKSGADGAAVDELRHDLRDLGARLAQSLADLTARLEQQSTSGAPASDGPALRDEFDRLGGRLADTLFDLERRMAAHVTARPAAAAVAPSESRSPGAVAKVVVSLADSLDFRFSQIELSLAELSLKAPGAAGRQENAATAAEMTSILTQVRAASDALKAGLSEFIGVSAALAEDVSVTKRAINGKSAA
jgi:hypothetical protein